MSLTTNQPVIDIDALAVGPALDAAVAEHVMGWERSVSDYDGNGAVEVYFWENYPTSAIAWEDLPRFSTDANRVHEVEAEIEKRKLIREYIEALRRVLYADQKVDYDAITGTVFRLMQATPAQRCRAALRVTQQGEIDE